MYVSDPGDPSPPSTSNFIPELPRFRRAPRSQTERAPAVEGRAAARGPAARGRRLAARGGDPAAPGRRSFARRSAAGVRSEVNNSQQ